MPLEQPRYSLLRNCMGRFRQFLSAYAKEWALPNVRCSWQARGVAAAAAGPILEVEPSSAAATVDVRLQLNAIR